MFDDRYELLLKLFDQSDISLGPDGADEELLETQIKLDKAHREIENLEQKLRKLKAKYNELQKENKHLQQTIHEMQSHEEMNTNNNSRERIVFSHKDIQPPTPRSSTRMCNCSKFVVSNEYFQGSKNEQ